MNKPNAQHELYPVYMSDAGWQALHKFRRQSQTPYSEIIGQAVTEFLQRMGFLPTPEQPMIEEDNSPNG